MVLKDAGAIPQIRSVDLDTLAEIERVPVDELKRAHHDRNLDHARAAERFVRPDRRLFARRQMLDVHAGARGKPIELRLEQPRQVGRRSLRDQQRRR